MYYWKLRIQTTSDSFHNLNNIFKIQHYILESTIKVVNKNLRLLYLDKEYITNKNIIEEYNYEIKLATSAENILKLRSSLENAYKLQDILLQKYKLNEAYIQNKIRKKLQYYKFNDPVYEKALATFIYTEIIEDAVPNDRKVQATWFNETFVCKGVLKERTVKSFNKLFLVKCKTKKDAEVLQRSDLLFVKFYRTFVKKDKYKYYCILVFKDREEDNNELLRHTSRFT